MKSFYIKRVFNQLIGLGFKKLSKSEKSLVVPYEDWKNKLVYKRNHLVIVPHFEIKERYVSVIIFDLRNINKDGNSNINNYVTLATLMSPFQETNNFIKNSSYHDMKSFEAACRYVFLILADELDSLNDQKRLIKSNVR